MTDTPYDEWSLPPNNPLQLDPSAAALDGTRFATPKTSATAVDPTVGEHEIQL